MPTRTITFTDGDINGPANEAALLARALIRNHMPHVTVDPTGTVPAITIHHDDEMVLGVAEAYINSYKK